LREKRIVGTVGQRKGGGVGSSFEKRIAMEWPNELGLLRDSLRRGSVFPLITEDTCQYKDGNEVGRRRKRVVRSYQKLPVRSNEQNRGRIEREKCVRTKILVQNILAHKSTSTE